MKLPQLAISNHLFVLVLVAMASGLGILSYLNMPRSEDPSLEFPLYNIIAVYPGASPEDLEQLVVNPVEDALSELEQITDISTEINEGIAVIKIEADYDIDVDDKFDEITASVNQVRGDLPDELRVLEVNKVSPQDVIILQIALLSETASYHDLVKWGDILENQMKQIDGIRSVEVSGYPEEEVRIALDMEEMSRRNISLNQVLGTLAQNHTNLPGGELSSGGRSFVVKTSGSYHSVEELRQTVIVGAGEQLVFLRDIASVTMEYEDPDYLTRYNGKRAVFVSVTQQKGKNILQIEEKMQPRLADFEASLPEEIALAAVFQQAPAVRTRVNDFFLNLLQGIFLVGAIILMFLGMRNAIIIMTVIPTSILIAIFLLDASDFGLQQISIAGLVIALGLLVDNGIVVVENIHRFLREGYPPMEAAAKGAAEVGWAIVSSTATTMLAFLPMTQLGGGTGQFVISLPVIVMFSLAASLLLALTLSPLLGSRLMTVKSAQPNRILRGLESMIANLYRPALQWALRRPWAMGGIAIASLVGSFALFPLVGVSFFPTADKPLVLIDIDLPKGSNLDMSDKATRHVEALLDTFPDVIGYAANVGQGNPQIYYNVIPAKSAPNVAQIIVALDHWDAEDFPLTVKTLRQRLENYPGARISVSELKNGPPYEAPVAIKVVGENLAVIRELSQNVSEIISSQEGVTNVDDPLAMGNTSLKAEILTEKAGMLGVSWVDVDLAMRATVAGHEIGTMTLDDGEEYPMMLRMADHYPAKISDFSRISVASRSGGQVPLNQVVKMRFEKASARIDHFDAQRTNMVTADVEEGYNVTEITLAVIEELNRMEWPAGYRYVVAGEFETQQESFGDLGGLLLVALLGILAVLVLQFRSIRQPLIVISAIPLAFSGSIIALFLSGYSFSFLAFIGFTSLVGIVVNTSIILVDYSNQLRQEGFAVRDAIQKAAETRFLPILLTTMTTIFGLLPLTLSGSDLWSPLGWTIIGGMVSSTLLTLLVVPVLYQGLTREA